MKKLFIVIFLAMICIMPFAVNAESNTYTTYSGAVVEKTKYDKMCEIYSVNYVETLSQAEFDELSSKDLDNVVKVKYEENNNTRGSYFASSAKAVYFIKNDNILTLTATWTAVPNVHSFDVMGVRLSGCTLNGGFAFKQTYVSSGSLYVVQNGINQTFSNGFGSSALLQYGTDNEYTMTFKVSGSGTVYGTYQHAMASISQSGSLDYTINLNGYGKVIAFSPSSALYYDQMNGVDIAV